MTDIEFEKQRTPLRINGAFQLLAGLLLLIGSFLPGAFGFSYPVVSAITAVLGPIALLTGALSLLLENRLPAVVQFALLATIVRIALLIVGYAGGVAILVLSQPFVFAALIATTVVFITYTVDLLSIPARRVVKVARRVSVAA